MPSEYKGFIHLMSRSTKHHGDFLNLNVKNVSIASRSEVRVAHFGVTVDFHL